MVQFTQLCVHSRCLWPSSSTDFLMRLTRLPPPPTAGAWPFAFAWMDKVVADFLEGVLVSARQHDGAHFGSPSTAAAARSVYSKPVERSVSWSVHDSISSRAI